MLFMAAVGCVTSLKHISEIYRVTICMDHIASAMMTGFCNFFGFDNRLCMVLYRKWSFLSFFYLKNWGSRYTFPTGRVRASERLASEQANNSVLFTYFFFFVWGPFLFDGGS